MPFSTSALAGAPKKIVTTASTNANIISATPRAIYNLVITNPVATAAVVKLYDKVTLPVPGTDVPVASFAIAAGTATAPGEKVLEFGALGMRFATGVGIAVTANAADADATNTVAGIKIYVTYA